MFDFYNLWILVFDLIMLGQVVEEVYVETHVPIPILDAEGLLQAVDRCDHWPKVGPFFEVDPGNSCYVQELSSSSY